MKFFLGHTIYKYETSLDFNYVKPCLDFIYAGFERSCPRDSKNVSYVDVGLV